MNDTTQVETQARSMGWAPKEDFKGDPEKWVDAAEFVRRGEEYVPFLRAERGRLNADLAKERTARQGLEAQLADLRESVETMKKTSIEETKRQVKAERERVKAELVKARKDGDHEAAVNLEDDLREIDKALDKAEAPAPAPKQAKQPPADPASDPVFTAWLDENPWMSDPIKSAAATAIAEQMRKAGDTTVGRAFFDKVTAKIEETFGMSKRPRGGSKVDASGGGNGSDNRRLGKRTVEDLPAEARTQIDREARTLVGPNRAFKTKAEWEAHFVEQYFAGEEA